MMPLNKCIRNFHLYHIQLSNALLYHHTSNSLHTVSAIRFYSFFLSIVVWIASISLQYWWHKARVLVLESKSRRWDKSSPFIHWQRGWTGLCEGCLQWSRIHHGSRSLSHYRHYFGRRIGLVMRFSVCRIVKTSFSPDFGVCWKQTLLTRFSPFIPSISHR